MKINNCVLEISVTLFIEQFNFNLAIVCSNSKRYFVLYLQDTMSATGMSNGTYFISRRYK